MAIIRQYQQQTSAPGAMKFQKLQGSDISSLGKGLSAAGDVAMDVADIWADKEKEKQAFEAEKKTAQEQQDLTKFMDEQKKAAPAGADGFTESVREELDKRKQKMLDEAPSEYMRTRLDANLIRVHMGAFQEAAGFEAEAEARKQKQDLTKIFDENNNLVRANPKRAALFAQQEAEMIATAPGLDNTLKFQMASERKQSIYNSAFDGEVTGLETGNKVTSGQVAAYLANAKNKDSDWVKNSSPEAYQSNIKRLERLSETLKEKEQTQMFADFDEKMDQIEKTGEDKGDYSEGWIKAHVTDSVKAEAMIKRQAMSRNIAKASSFVKDAPVTSITDKLKELEEQRKSTDKFHVVNAEYESTVSALNRRNQEFKQDPVGYTLGVSSAAQNVFKQFAENPSPEMADQYASTVKAEQQRLYPGTIPSLLTKDQIGSIASQMSAVKTDEKGALDAVNVLQSQMNTWGKHWPTVARDLKANKALNDGQYVAATMLDKPHYRYVAEDLVKASMVKEEDLKLPPKTKTNAEQSATEALAPLRQTLDSMVDGPEIYKSYHNALTKTLLYKSSMTGTDQSGLATDYANKMVLEGYDFAGSYRIPKNQDVSAVRAGVNSALMRVEKMDIVTPQAIPDQMGWTPRAEDVKSRYMNDLKRFGRIVNNGDESGLRLVDQHGRQVMTNKDGKQVPLKWSWSEVKTLRISEAEKLEEVRAGLRNSPYYKPPKEEQRDLNFGQGARGVGVR
jgi:hypothetical protein